MDIFPSLSDAVGIQTLNLLIRSQMLYSVELQRQLLYFPKAMQKYVFFFKVPNKSREKNTQTRFFFGFAFISHHYVAFSIFFFLVLL